jgi:hypothetical protein
MQNAKRPMKQQRLIEINIGTIDRGIENERGRINTSIEIVP